MIVTVGDFVIDSESDYFSYKGRLLHISILETLHIATIQHEIRPDRIELIATVRGCYSDRKLQH